MLPLEVSFWRAAISSSLFVLHAVSTQQLRLHRQRDLILPSSLVCEQYTSSTFMAIVAHFLFGEKLSAYKISLFLMLESI
jgi:hypothetical protein